MREGAAVSKIYLHWHHLGKLQKIEISYGNGIIGIGYFKFNFGNLGRTSDSLVELDPNEQRFNVHYCANSASGGQQQCGENSICGTIYRKSSIKWIYYFIFNCHLGWKKAMVRVDTTAALSATMADDLPDIFLQEQVLVPSGCSCLINAANTKFAKMPIIIES